jgi:hypothetical protein
VRRIIPLRQNKYHEAIDRITTPPELKEKTRRMIHARTRRRIPPWQAWGLSSAAAIMALVVGLYVWMSMERDWIETGLIAGEHQEVVQVQDGELQFAVLDAEEIDTPILLAPAFPLHQNIELDDYPGVLPVYAPEGFNPPEGEITLFFLEPSDVPDAILGRAIYSGEGGATLTLTFTNDPNLLFTPIEIGDTQIAEILVGVGFSEAENTYLGIYQKGYYHFLLSSADIDQETFLRILHYFITN